MESDKKTAKLTMIIAKDDENTKRLSNNEKEMATDYSKFNI